MSQTSDTTYTDKAADPQSNSYWYKIIAEDNCGNTSAFSQVARSILLKGSVQGNDANATLNWNAYEGFNVAKNELQRDNALYASPVLMDYNDTYFYNNQFNGHDYRISALENANNGLISWSNTLHLYYQPHIWAPNVFSPQGDNINDTYQVGTSGITAYHLSILNRWGEILFQTDDMKAGWDGRFHGLDSPEGVYMYQIRAHAANGTWINKSGTICLIRK